MVSVAHARMVRFSGLKPLLLRGINLHVGVLGLSVAFWDGGTRGPASGPPHYTTESS